MDQVKKKTIITMWLSFRKKLQAQIYFLFLLNPAAHFESEGIIISLLKTDIVLSI